jgi:hypothetical protein
LDVMNLSAPTNSVHEQERVQHGGRDAGQDERPEHRHQRPGRRRAVDRGGLGQLPGDLQEGVAHHEHAERQVERRVEQREAGQVVGQPEGVHLKEERGEQRLERDHHRDEHEREHYARPAESEAGDLLPVPAARQSGTRRRCRLARRRPRHQS